MTPPKSPPARETQIAHLLTLAAHFGVDRAALEAEIGKPLEELTQKETRFWNGRYMRRIAEERPPKRPIDRKRAHLPEGVDGFELAYRRSSRRPVCRFTSPSSTARPLRGRGSVSAPTRSPSAVASGAIP